MRLNGAFFCVLVVFCSIFWVCERSDVISGVAEDVVSGADSALTNPNRFVRVDLDSGDVVGAFSLPAAANPAFSTTFGGIAVGLNEHDDTLAAYFQYLIAIDTSRYNKNDSLEAYLYFRAADTTDAADTAGSSNTISLYRVNPLDESAPVNMADRHPDAENDTIWPVKFTLRNGNEADTVKLPNSVAKQIFEARSDTIPFAFNIADYYGKTRRIQNPDMVIIVLKTEKADSAGSVMDTVIDTTIRAESSRIRFTAFENQDSVPTRKDLPYSSQHTRRTAVFEISLGKIITELGKPDEYANLNAVILVKPGRVISGVDSGYKIFVSDTLFKAPDTASINERFKKGSPLRPVQPYNTLSIRDSTSTNPSLQSVLNRGRKSLYVYLRADSDNGVILWDEPEPIRIETVFTPTPSR